MAQKLAHIRPATKIVSVHMHGVTVSTEVPRHTPDLIAVESLLGRIHRQEGYTCNCDGKCKTCKCN